MTRPEDVHATNFICFTNSANLLDIFRPTHHEISRIYLFEKKKEIFVRFGFGNV